jgi:hypothetical protein
VYEDEAGCGDADCRNDGIRHTSTTTHLCCSRLPQRDAKVLLLQLRGVSTQISHERCSIFASSASSVAMSSALYRLVLSYG